MLTDLTLPPHVTGGTAFEKYREQMRLAKHMPMADAYKQAWGEEQVINYKDLDWCVARLCPMYREALQLGFGAMNQDQKGNWYFTVTSIKFNALMDKYRTAAYHKEMAWHNLRGWGEILEKES